MDQQLWKKAEQLFHSAIKLPIEKRVEFVKEAASNDRQLQIEVLTLIDSYDQENGELENPSRSHLSDALNEIADQIQLGSSEQTAISSTNDDGDDDSELQTPDGLESSWQSSKDERLVKLIESTRDDFVVKRVISRGGMGVVFRVYQRKLDRDVAVKVLSAPHLDDRIRNRFVRESQAIAQIKNDHVIRIYEVSHDQEIPLLVMELIDGPSLKRFIEVNRSIDPNVAAELARQIAIGLDAAHKKNLVHRDVKPANILLEPDSTVSSDLVRSKPSFDVGHRVRIVDFGLARDIDNPTGETREQMFAGTLSYMSPEQLARPETVDHRSDIYSLGMTLYQMLTGERPFHGAPHMVIRKIESAEPTPPRKLDDRIPRDLESICLKALNKDREKRYPTAMDMAEDLDRFLTNRPTQARPVSAMEKTTRWIHRNKRVSTLIALVAGLMLALTIGSLTFAFIVRNKNNEISRQRRLASENLVQRVIDADPAALLFAIEDLNPSDPSSLKSLQSEFSNKDNGFSAKFNSAIALSLLGESKSEFLLDNLDQLFTSPAVCLSIVKALEVDPASVNKLKTKLKTQSSLESRARTILLLAGLGNFDEWIVAANNRKDPSLVTEVIHQFRNWHSDLSQLVTQLESKNVPALDWSLCHALWLIDYRSLRTSTRELLVDWLTARTNSPTYLNSRSARQVLEKWNQTIDSPKPQDKKPNRNWYSLSNGIVMVLIEPGTSRMGRLESNKMLGGYPAHKVTITKPFYMADCEVTVEQFNEFIKEGIESSDGPVEENWENVKDISSSASHPVNSVSFADTLRFCNWLSRKHDLQPVYKLRSKELLEFKSNDGYTFQYEDWEIDDNANGYRLPYEHEFEWACRYGSETKYHYGQQRNYYDSYGLFSNNLLVPTNPVRAKLPNQNGLFDLHGNLWEWCNDWHSNISTEPLIDPRGPDGPMEPGFGRVYRGGGIATRRGEADAESRGATAPRNRNYNNGFRVVRYADDN